MYVYMLIIQPKLGFLSPSTVLSSLLPNTIMPDYMYMYMYVHCTHTHVHVSVHCTCTCILKGKRSYFENLALSISLSSLFFQPGMMAGVPYLSRRSFARSRYTSCMYKYMYIHVHVHLHCILMKSENKEEVI